MKTVTYLGFLAMAIASGLVFSACGLVQRHPDSGYQTSSPFSSSLDEVELSAKAIRSPSSLPSSLPRVNIPKAIQPQELQTIIESEDIAVGMSKEDVAESWGTPDVVEVSGSTRSGNERWTYRAYLPSKDGYQSQDRQIYFRNGRVAGWKSLARGI